MGEPWARHHERQQPKTQETLPPAGFPLERMTRFELATLTLAKKRAGTNPLRSATCADVAFRPWIRPPSGVLSMR
jgi:hypothetical protein